MRTQKWLIPLGMIGVLSFLALTILGRILWPGYNPVTTYTSALIADGAPHPHIMRVFMNAYTICFCLFALAMAAHTYKEYRACTKIGYVLLFVVSFTALLGYGACPISLELIFSANDIFHLAVTIAILCVTALSLLLISIGYLKQERLRMLGCICITIWTIYVLLNIWHLYAVLHGQNILGLLQRLTFYSFHAFTFIISWVYTFKRGNTKLFGNGR